MNKYTITIVCLVVLFFVLDYIPRNTQKQLVVAMIDMQKVSTPVPVVKNTVLVKKDIVSPPIKKAKVSNVAKIPLPQPPNNPQRIQKKGWSKNDEIQNLVNYAYKKGGKDFLLTLEGENGLWKWDRKSMIVWSNGYSDYGMCQVNAQFHARFIFANGQNLKAWFWKDFQDPYKQIDYCYWVFKDAIVKWRIKTTFYAYNVRQSKVARFENLP